MTGLELRSEHGALRISWVIDRIVSAVACADGCLNNGVNKVAMTLPDLRNPDQYALFLDFDGTLVAIADRPDDVRWIPRLGSPSRTSTSC